MITPIQACRSCSNTDLTQVLSLGNQFVVDFVKDQDTVTRPLAPLDLLLCNHCSLLQLKHSVSPDILFKRFWYRSGISEVMRSALADIVTKTMAMVRLKSEDAVLDIGANDGTLLSLYPTWVGNRVAIEPAENVLLEAIANKRVDVAVCEYFNSQSAVRGLQLVKKDSYRIISAAAMFYDLEDPAAFLTDVKSVLADDGVFVVQMNYLLGMLQQNAFDNICHEHLTYFSLHSLKWLAERCGLFPIDVEVNDVNGGSFRVYFSKLGTKYHNAEAGQQRIEAQLNKEIQYGLADPLTYYSFAARVDSIINHLDKTIIEQAEKGWDIYLYGASTRGSTLMQALSPEATRYIKGAAERDENKWGLKMVGTMIPIISEEKARKVADMFIVLPWHFRKGIVERERHWLNEGGQFLFPLPLPTWVHAFGEEQMIPVTTAKQGA